MRKLKVGVWLQEDYRPEEGGGYGYYTQLISALNQTNFKDAEIIFISDKNKETNKHLKNVYVLKSGFNKINKHSFNTKLVDNVRHLLSKYLFKNQYFRIDEQIKRNTVTELSNIVDLIYYPIPGCRLDTFPFVYTLWDIGHLSMYAFPEVSMNRIFNERQKHYNYIQKALMIFTESEKGKQEAIQYLGLNSKRIKVVPIFPSEIISDKINEERPVQLKEESFFIHYPAQFWSHKNHYNLLQAFTLVLKSKPNLKLVLTGSDKGNKTYILDLIQQFDLKNAVFDLGFIKNEELKWLYKNSQGLVMPTFLGPTNMPLLEAAELECPVACSSLEGHVEQLAGYGYYFNPLNHEEIAEAILQMISDNEKGNKRKYNPTFKIENTLKNIDHAFSELKDIRFCWGKNYIPK